MPSKQQIHIDKVLTNMSVQYAQDLNTFIADKVFPRISVAQQSNLFYKYKKEDWFRSEAEQRAAGTESVGGDYELDTDTYFCKRYAFHKDITDEERANADTPLQPDTDAMQFVVEKMYLKRELDWINGFFTPGKWGTDVTGSTTSGVDQVVQWSDYGNSDPIGDISKYKTKMAETTGKLPNTMVMSYAVYEMIKNHPDILDRIKYTQKGVASSDLLKELFDVDRLFVSAAIQNTAKKGQDASMGYMMSNGLLLCHNDPNPGLKKASAGYTFTWNGLLGANALQSRINRFAMPMLGIGTERIEAEMCYDMKIVAGDLGIFFKDIIG